MPNFFQNFIDDSFQENDDKDNEDERKNKNEDDDDERKNKNYDYDDEKKNKNKGKVVNVIENKNSRIFKKKIKYPEIISPFIKGEIVRIKNDRELKGTLVTINSIHEDYVRVYSNANYMSEKLFKVPFYNVVKVKREYTES